MRSSLQPSQVFGVLLGVLAIFGAARAASPVLTTLYQFSGSADGGYPTAPVAIGAGGVLYGTTIYGGASGNGAVFSLTPPTAPGNAWTEAVIYSFTGGSDGGSPLAGLVIGANGVIYGVAGGGIYGDGVVFSVTPPVSPGDQWAEAILHSFSSDLPSTVDGGGPAGSLVLGRDGTLYGTTALGGVYGMGVAFSLTPPSSHGGAWTELLLYSFGANGDAAGPRGLVGGPGGVLYGIGGGGAYNLGSVFSLTPPSTQGGVWQEAVLHSFSGYFSDGGPPMANSVAVGAGGVLYGATYYGGAYQRGTIFSLTPPTAPGGAWTEAVLYNFSFQSGEKPEGGLTLSKAGILYGTTSTGGNTFSASGTIFQLAPPSSTGGAWKYTRLYVFPYDATPMAGLVIGSGSVLYGTTSGGPYARTGSVFSFVP